MRWGTSVRTVLLVVALVSAAGCSGDDGDGSATPSSAPAATSSVPEPTTVAAPTSTAPAPTTSTAPTPTTVARTTTSEPVAEVTGPVTGGAYGLPFNPMPAALAAQYGYTESEFFVSGTATSYAPQGPLGSDGVWTLAPAATAAYTTRILVRRPTDAAAFNGTVVVEWLNVSVGMDQDPTFGQAHDELLRSGFVWVGVSAQASGVMGSAARIPIEGLAIQPLKDWDPARYGPLTHPGDEYSYDMLSQIGEVVRAPGTVDPLGGLEPSAVIAAGESQSAFRLVSYINGVQPIEGVFDGFLVHSRGDSGAPFGPDPSAEPASPTMIRGDIEVPVLQLEMETDILRLGFAAARQPDTDRLRTWEVAGTAHADASTLTYAGESSAAWSDLAASDLLRSLCGSINDGPQTYLVRSAIAALDRWVRDGVAPPSAVAIDVIDGAIARDHIGNATGGIRTYAVDVPVASLSGETPADRSIICSLFGDSVPLPADQLAARYPTHDAYVDAVSASVDAGVEAGFILATDAPEIVAAAEAAPIPA